MSSEIENISLRFNCDADWDSMPYADGIKHCDHCQKNVYDFTDAKQAEFLAILAENDNSVCGRFRPEQMGSKSQTLPVWKKWVSAALVLVGINIFNNKVEAQAKPKADSVSTAKADTNLVFGIFETEPQFPGGMLAFQKFIKSNLRFSKGTLNGKVIINFLINTDGTLSNFRVLRSPGEINSAEAVRLLKLSPKWKPDLQKGKYIVKSYTAVIVFER